MNTHAAKRAADARIRATPLTDEQQRLVEDNRALVYFIVRRHCTPRTRRRLEDDLVSAGMIGLVRAAQGYDPERGAFSAYAVRHIRTAVADEIANHYTIPLPLSAFRDCHLPDSKQAAVRATRQAAPVREEITPSRENDDLRTLEDREYLLWLAEQLPTPQQRQLFRMILEQPDSTHADLAAALGCTRSNTQAVLARAFEYLWQHRDELQ